MRIAIIADIHSNLPALRAVLDVVNTSPVDHYLCLGDVVGYGPDPKGCIELLEGLSITHIQGNHEARLLDEPTGRFNVVAEAAIEYTKQALADPEMAFLRTFPEQTLFRDDILCVHGSPFDRDEYVMTQAQMKAVLDYIDSWLCFCGHTHQQYLFDGDGIRIGPIETVLSRDKKYLINPGSVGQPRDGDSRAAFATLDTDTGALHMQRVEYDIQDTASRIHQAGLPEYLADRLFAGK